MSPVEQTELLFIILLVFVIGFGWLSHILKTPYPIVLVIAGLLLSVIPGLPRIHLNPDFIFLSVLPPLLFSAAFNTSWRDFRYNLVSICSLAFALVAFSVFGIAAIAHFLLPGFDWRLGLVLGSVIAPTDAIAATAIAKRLHLPHRIIDLLEGESLVNDATGLLALEFTTALIVTGRTPSIGEGIFRFFFLLGGGILVGFLVGWLVFFFEKRVDDAPIEVTLSLVVPYIAYIGAETIHASGVLAAVAAGLYLGNHRSSYTSSAVRVESRSFWNTLTFVLNGVVFLLIGLQLPLILGGIRGIAPRQLLVDTVQIVMAVILLRLIWVYPGSSLAHLIRTRILHQSESKPTLPFLFMIGWTGMRGVISLAAAIALPEAIANGEPFPQRNMIIYFTFAIIFVTTVLQGLSLPYIIHWLGMGQSTGRPVQEIEAREKILRASIQELELRRKRDAAQFAPLYDDLVTIYKRRLNTVLDGNEENSDSDGAPLRQRFGDVSREMRSFERHTAQRLRLDQEINDELFRNLEHELDLRDLRSA